jgi:hypothetical protein
LFQKAVIHLANGRSITINAPAAAADRPYVQKLTLNGRTWDRTSLPSSILRDGATLNFDLSAQPNEQWAVNAAPPSYSEGQVGAIGYTSPTGQVVARQGTSFPAAVGTVDTDGRADVVRWTAKPPPGITVTPSSGVLNGRQTQPVTIAVAADTPSGYHPVPISFNDGALPGGTITVTVAAADGRATVCDTLGATDTECGLQRRDNDDGRSEPVEGGRKTLNGYLYFAVTDDLVPPGSAHTATITVDYLDQGTTTWNVQYDSTGEAYRGSASVTNTGTGTWKQATFTLPDAGFGNRQNAAADFRLSTGAGFVIAKVHVAVSGGTVLPLHLCPGD